MTTKQSEKGITKKGAMKRKCFLPECTVLRSRLNSRNKYKVHLQTFIHVRLQQPSRCPPLCWCMPAERWNGEENGGFPSFPQRKKQERRRTDRLWECQCRCVRGLWWVQSEWEEHGQTAHFHCTRPRKVKQKKAERSPKFEWLPDTRSPGLRVCSEGREARRCSFFVYIPTLGERNSVAYLKVSWQNQVNILPACFLKLAHKVRLIRQKIITDH